MRAFFLACALFLAALSASAQMYKVVGADGKVTYTDRPVAASGKVAAVQGAVSVGDAPGGGAMRKRVVMYTTAWCPACKAARNHMNSQGIAFTEYDVEKDANRRKEYQSLGGRGVPLIVVGNQTMTGFSADRLAAMLK